MKKSKIIAVLLTAALLAGTLGACADEGAQSQPAPAPQPASSAAQPAEPEAAYEGAMPIAEEPIKLTVLTHSGSAAQMLPPSNDLLYYKTTQELTGVEIEWEIVPYESYSEVLQTRLASGQDLPDIINLYNGVNVSNAAKNNQIIPLDDLLERYGYYIRKWWDSGYDYTRPMWQSYDGNIHAIYSYVIPDYGQIGPMYNKVWLDELGAEVPTTLEEFEELVYAMKEHGDFNGNGDDDEIIFTGDNLNNFNHFSFTFGLSICHGTNNGYQADENDVVTANYVDDRYKEMLQFCNKLYADGILDKEVITNTYAVMDEKAAADRVGIVYGYSTFADTYGNLTSYGQEAPGEQWYIAGPPLKGPHGDQYMLSRIQQGGDPMAITTACENPEAALKWLDYVFASDENITLRYFGVEGTDYTLGADGSIEIIEPADGTPFIDHIYSYGGNQTPLAHIQSLEQRKLTYAPWMIATDEERLPYYKLPLLPLGWTEEEEAAISSYNADITSYFTEMEGKFISGEESFDKWDDYVNTMMALHLPEVTAAWQSRYDRQLASQ